MYLHLVCELLYKIEWPSVRRLRIVILCTYWNFGRALPYSLIESTQSPWESASRNDVAEVMTNPLHVVQIMIVRCNANFLDMSDGILEWEATHTLKNYPLNLRVIGIREVKDVIHPLMKHASRV